ncbi:MAG: hypothetical protein R3D68_00850 [Hyphomicrobiaceae bacterium]
MLPRLVTFVLQVAITWYLTPVIKAALPTFSLRPYDILVDAVLFALVIVLVGFTCALTLKNVKKPGGGTLIASIVLGLVFAGLTLVPQIVQAIDGAVPALRTMHVVYPMAGALLGYYVKR